MRSIAVGAVAIGLAAVGGGCSGGGNKPEPRGTPPTPVPSVAEAKQAIKRHARANTGELRSIQNCRSENGATTCAVEYTDSCEVLEVTRKASRFTVAPAGGLCLYSYSVSTTHISTAP